ncbi:hypothetical protein [Dyadobacter sp. CY312]|uniref:hypothetical protein n=1 Tax=Dyadobacter sp. CY312 TaxID=2907303 RepID=UPI001F45C3CC|nr:hypothetical protein [Dyadobacter sp. CY312]MCE7042048.1 hypothetical protein [Dyadobacter sp. CY312]
MKITHRVNSIIFIIYLFKPIGCVDKAAAEASKIVGVLTASLDDTIAQLQLSSDGWAVIVDDLAIRVTDIIDDNKDELLQVVKNDIVNTVDRFPGRVGIEFRCNSDFLRDRIIADLVRIKMRLIGGKPMDLVPSMCSVIPSAFILQNKPDVIDFFGYNLDRGKDVKIYMLHRNGFKEDVTFALSQPSHYHWVLNLGYNGLTPKDSSDKIVINWGNKEVSSIPIVHPEPKICQSIPFTIKNTTTPTFVPEKIEGDEIFGGNKVKINLVVFLRNDKNSVWASVTMLASEWEKDKDERSTDKTAAHGSKEFLIFQAPYGKEIEKIEGSKVLAFSRTYSTSVDNEEVLEPMESGMGSYRLFVNKKNQRVIGTYTGVQLIFTRIPIVLKEISNCVSSNAIYGLSKNQQKLILQKSAMKFQDIRGR